jgi:hypothetical protein
MKKRRLKQLPLHQIIPLKAGFRFFGSQSVAAVGLLPLSAKNRYSDEGHL